MKTHDISKGDVLRVWNEAESTFALYTVTDIECGYSIRFVQIDGERLEPKTRLQELNLEADTLLYQLERIAEQKERLVGVEEKA